jgi:acetate---CoA ligase (ADP-forming)
MDNPMMYDADRVRQIDAIFHSRSVAIVGLPRELKTGKLYLHALRDQGFPGAIYPVNPKATEIDGLRCYPEVAAIPGSVDLAIVLVPARHTLPIVRQCAEKGVKAVVLFTAGYRESGTMEGALLETELTSVARRTGMRLIGPNGMGIYAPASGLSFFPGLSHRVGNVSLLSHSGSLSNIICGLAPSRGVYFNKAISLGNECDLSAAELLRYYGQDDGTAVITAYIEGFRDGEAFRQALAETSRYKPVVIWKVGLNPEGARAAASHTGSLGGSSETWQGLTRQYGIVTVSGIESWLDLLMGFSLSPVVNGDRIAIISGPGGLGVGAAEACGNAGLRLAELSPASLNELAGFMPPTGTSRSNPIDVGMSASIDIEIYHRAVAVAAADPGVDALMIIGAGISAETNRSFIESVIETRSSVDKTFFMINVPHVTQDMAPAFCQAGIPFFASAERAFDTYAQMLRYEVWKAAVTGFSA